MPIHKGGTLSRLCGLRTGASAGSRVAGGIDNDDDIKHCHPYLTQMTVFQEESVSGEMRLHFKNENEYRMDLN